MTNDLTTTTTTIILLYLGKKKLQIFVHPQISSSTTSQEGFAQSAQ